MPNFLDLTNAFPGDLPRREARARQAMFAERFSSALSGSEGGKLPFVNLPHCPELFLELEKLKPFFEGFTHMLVLGIGGSALGARALQKAFYPAQDQPGHNGKCLWIADNIDVISMNALMHKLAPEKTLVVTISKSGGTIETAAQYFLIKRWLMEALGGKWKDHMLVVTGSSGHMRDEVKENGLRNLPVPTYLGGRYSVLSAVGLVPAAFLGLDIKELVTGALSISKPLFDDVLTAKTLAAHPSWTLATWAWSLMESNLDELIFFCYVPPFATFGAWFAQLWAESLGKEGKGSMPLPAVGVTDQHSLQQMFLDGPKNKGCLFITCPLLPEGPNFPTGLGDEYAYLSGKSLGDLLAAEALGTRMALAESGVPVIELSLGGYGLYQAGQLMMLLELATLFTGWLIDIEPLDQPAVELGKRLAKARLGAEGLDSEKARLEAFVLTSRELKEF